MEWQDIQVSSKILGHISAGVYRSPAGAIKELVSNAFDANAARVSITTNWPSFDIITCRDNGSGITLDKFNSMMSGGIGDSSKRSAIDGEVIDTTDQLNRPIIGWLGIGMLGVAQICHEFRVISHHLETRTAFQATIQLMDFLREKISEIDPEYTPEHDIEVGKFVIQEIDFDEEETGTYVIASDMRSAFVKKFRGSLGDNPVPIPSIFSSFLKTIHDAKSVKELDDYWQMVWELALASPVRYMNDNGPFNWDWVKASSDLKSDVKKRTDLLSSYEFEVVVDGLSLRKPNSFPYPRLRRRTNQNLTGQLFPIDINEKVYGQTLKLFGYLYLQDGQAIEPVELRGLLIRIRNIAIGSYDSTFFKYPSIQGPRFNWLSGEIFVEEGLEFALNIDRDSFNEMHPHYVRLQKIIHKLLQDVFLEAGRGVKERSRTKQEERRIEKQEELTALVSKEFGDDFKIIRATEGKEDTPLTQIDTTDKAIVVNPSSKLLPRANSKQDLVIALALAFEISMKSPEEERREKFLSLLSELIKTGLL